MPGASLVAAVVSPDVLEALPGDKEVFFGMLHLECGTSCTKTDGIWLLQGQWAQVKDAVMLLDIIERSKNSNQTLVEQVFFADPINDDSISYNDSGSKKGRFQQRFVVQWTAFFNEIQKDFPQVVIEKFKRVVTAAVKKEEETRRNNQNEITLNVRRPLTRRKGLPHRLTSAAAENPLATALAIAFESERNNAANHSQGHFGEIDNEDAASVDSVDSIDIREALVDNADEEYTTKRKGKRKKPTKSTKKNAGSNEKVVRRDGKAKIARISRRSADALNKLLRNLTADSPLSLGNPVNNYSRNDDNLQRSSDDLVFSTSDMVFPSRLEDDHHQSVEMDLTQDDLTQENIEEPQQPQAQQLTAPVYRCPVCSTFTSDSRGGVKIHAFSVHLAASYRCYVCKGVYSSRHALERHRASHRHETFPFLKCLCSRILTSRSGLTRHIATCNSLILGARLIEDPTAADGFSENVAPFDANGNARKFPGRRPRPDQFVCDICNSFSAPSGPKLVHHKLTSHPDEALKCSSCSSLTFKDFAEFHEHNSLHVTKLPCEHCGKIFSNVRSYEMHQRTHESGFEKAAFVCTICAKAFTTAYVLKYHMQHSHLDLGKRFQCSRCGRHFSQKIHLIEHLYSHDGLKPYMCDMCGRGFSHQTSLQQHKLTHGEEARYKCQDCPKSFRTRASLLMHRNCHTERKHQCQFCGKLFTQKTARIRHERIHTGEQPYKCTSCNKAFSDSSVLRRHLVTHDPNHPTKRSIAAAKKAAAGEMTASTSAEAGNQIGTDAFIVDLTSLIPATQIPAPNAAQKVTKPRAPRVNRAGGNRTGRNSKKTAPTVSNNLPLLQFGGNSGYCQQPAIDSALDLHIFSPMSVLVQQPVSSINMQQAGQQHSALITSEQCPSPETPPPISVPDLQNVVDEPRLFHQPQAQNLVFSPQRAHENSPTGTTEYHVIQLPPEAVQIVQMAGPSNLSSRNSGGGGGNPNNVSKFSSYLHHHQQQQEPNRPPSNSTVESSALMQGALQCSAENSGNNNQTSRLQQQQQGMYSLGSSHQSSSTVVDLVGSSGGSGHMIQPFFLSSDGSGSGALFAVPADAFFSMQSHQQAPDSPPPPQTQQHQPSSCSYQFSDMHLNLVDNQQQQQQQNSISEQIMYQSVPAAFFANMDGTAIPISSLNIFNEQFGIGNSGIVSTGGNSGRHLINHSQLMGGGDISANNGSIPGSSQAGMMHPLLQMPPPLGRPQNAHQRVNNTQYH